METIFKIALVLTVTSLCLAGSSTAGAVLGARILKMPDQSAAVMAPVLALGAYGSLGFGSLSVGLLAVEIISTLLGGL